MTEQDRPTMPVAPDAAPAESDAHDRETLPAPPPEDMQAATPESDSAPTPAVSGTVPLLRDGASSPGGDTVPLLRDGTSSPGGSAPALGGNASGIGLAPGDAPTEVELRDSDIETWPPPPPVPQVAPPSIDGTAPALRGDASSIVAATATPERAASAETGSSIAPRELSQRPPPAPRSSRAGIALLGGAVLFGAVAIVLSRFERPTRDTGADAPREVATSAAMPAERDPIEPAAAPSAAAVEPAEAIANPLPTDTANGASPVTGESAAQPLARTATAERTSSTPARTVRRRAAPARTKVALVPADLPEAPSRASIAASLNDLRSAIALCTDGRNGVAELDLTIHGSGAVAHALVGGDFAGTPQGSCIARTLRKASFAPFQKAKFRVLYKLML